METGVRNKQWSLAAILSRRCGAKALPFQWKASTLTLGRQRLADGKAKALRRS